MRGKTCAALALAVALGSGACELAPQGASLPSRSGRAGAPPRPPSPPPERESESERESARAAASYLARACEPSGRFAYLRHVEVGGDRSGGEYNVLRHAGALYALDQAWRELRLPEARAALLRGARYLIERHLRSWPEGAPAAGQLHLAAIVSLEGEEVERECAKLGGSGLGLVALCAARRLEPALIGLERLRELGAFVLACQEPSGSFRAKRYADGSWSSFRSLYYPGEAILGLIRLAEQDPDPRWLKAAAMGAAYLARSRAEVPPAELPHDHWLLIACAELWPRWGELKPPPIPQAVLRRHLDELARVFLARQAEVAAQGEFRGAFERRGATCPTATRLEGLVAYASLPAGSPQAPSAAELQGGIARGLAFLRGAQVQAPSEVRGAIPRAWLRGQDASGPRGDLRIDFTQHALSALLGGARGER